MILDLKEGLFRFIVPPCLFWSILYLLGTLTPSLIGIYADSSVMVTLLLIIFVMSGFVIGAVGTLVCFLIELIVEVTNKKKHPAWFRKEISYWDKIAKREEYIKGKIETTWNFYTMNINSAAAVVLVIPTLYYFTGNLSSINVFYFLSVLLLFTSIALLNLQKILRIASDVSSSS